MVAPLVPAGLGLVAGLLLARWVGCGPCDGRWLAAAAVALLGIAWLARRRRVAGAIAIVLLWIVLGWWRSLQAATPPASDLSSLPLADSSDVAVHGVIVDDPVPPFHDDGPARVSAVVRVDALRSADGWRAVTGRVRATVHAPRVPLGFGDEVLLNGRLSPVPPPSNPGQFDGRALLARQGIHRLLRVAPYDAAVRLRTGRGGVIGRAIIRWRRRWEALLDRVAAPEDAALLRSLVLGQRTAIDPALRRAFVETGTVHLLVISGFNVGIVAWLVDGLLRLAGCSWRPRVLACAIALAGYCELVGAQPPVARATVMAGVVLWARWLDRAVDWPNALAAAALAMLWVAPSQLEDAGFQLSFGAVASLLLITPKLPLMDRADLGRAARVLLAGVAATVAVWIGLWPVLAWYFFCLTPVSLLANLVLVPLVSLIVGVATGVLLAASVWPGCMTLAAPALHVVLAILTGTVRWCHAVPGGSGVIGRPPLWLALGYYMLLLATWLGERLGLSRRRLGILWLACATTLIWGAAIPRAVRAPAVELTILDVGHGDGLVLRTTRGATVLVDAGTEDAGRFVVVPFLRSRGVRGLDALILTHPDDDHVAGAVAVLEAMPVRQLLSNGTLARSSAGRRVLDAARARGLREQPLAAGDRLIGAGLELDVLHPPRRLVPGVPERSNDNSLVLRLRHGRFAALLTGDLESAGLPWLLATDQPLRADVLKVPHHGSALGAVGWPWLERVRPAVAVISVGRLHRLPAASSVDELRRIGARTWLTREQGSVTVWSDGHRLRVRPFRGEAWQREL